MIYIGIDPGVKGAIAWISDDGYGAVKMPPTTKQVYDKIVDLAVARNASVTVEQVQVMGKVFGAKAALSYGQKYGEIIGILTALGIPIREVRAAVWKKGMNLDKDKNNSILKCERLFPKLQLIPPGCRVVQDGLAEAILLAEYGRKMEHGWHLSED